MGERRWVVAAAIVAVVALVAVGGGGLWLRSQVAPSGGPGKAVDVDIPQGTSTDGVAELLSSKDVIGSARVFSLYVRLKNAGPFEAGLYHLRENSSMGDVVSLLDRGPSLPAAVNITIPEGFVVAQVAKRVANKDPRLKESAFLDATTKGDIRSRYSPPGQTSLEGLLFPETYRVEDTETERDVVREMVNTYDGIAQGLGYDQAKQLTGYSAYEVTIVASLVEAEAKTDADRPKIARVIYNRLAKGMPLGIDAAFYYTLPLDRRGTPLRQSDLDRDTPYNTRLHTGLTPTPISNPGEPSLQAALHPADGDWLYYVLQDQTTHAFTDNYQEFLRLQASARQKGLLG